MGRHFFERCDEVVAHARAARACSLTPSGAPGGAVLAHCASLLLFS
jgi:hypothetical protein